MIGPFEAGERILLVDQRDRRYLVTLQTDETWHSHGGGLSHDLLIGSPEGTLVHSASGMAFRAFRPRLADFVLKMPRGAQVVYPKDVGAILVGADVFPGARVLEAGTGSGSLTLACAGPPVPRAGSSPTTCGPSSRRGRLGTSSPSSGRRRTGSSSAGRRPRRRGERPDLRPRDPGSPGAVGDARAARDRAAPGRDLLRVPADDEPGPTARARVGTQRVRAPRDVRGPPSLVARDRAERPTGPADGRAHRVHHARASRLSDHLARVRRQPLTRRGIQ
jgi:tRNA(1-methyladenosine) methyltransferase and related methyltransferases